MAHQEFSLQVEISKEYPIRPPSQTRYHCHNSDGLSYCDCIMDRQNRGSEGCCFYGRPIEPLAFYLAPCSEVEQQIQAPLYGLLPKEMRQLVWEFALADNNALAPDCDNVFRRECGTVADVARSDVAHALPQTCKAVYLKSYRLPMQLNGRDFSRDVSRIGTSGFTVRIANLV